MLTLVLIWFDIEIIFKVGAGLQVKWFAVKTNKFDLCWHEYVYIETFEQTQFLSHYTEWFSLNFRIWSRLRSNLRKVAIFKSRFTPLSHSETKWYIHLPPLPHGHLTNINEIFFRKNIKFCKFVLIWCITWLESIYTFKPLHYFPLCPSVPLGTWRNLRTFPLG